MITGGKRWRRYEISAIARAYRWSRFRATGYPDNATPSAARGAIRDTGATGSDRYHWTVTVFGDTDPVASGRTGDLAEARSQAEEALLAFAEGGGVLGGSGAN